MLSSRQDMDVAPSQIFQGASGKPSDVDTEHLRYLPEIRRLRDVKAAWLRKNKRAIRERARKEGRDFYADDETTMPSYILEYWGYIQAYLKADDMVKRLEGVRAEQPPRESRKGK